MAHIPEIAAVCAVCVLDDAGRRPVISCAERWEFLGQGIHGVGLILARVIRIPGKPSVIKCQQVIHTAVRPLPVIQMEQEPIPVHLHLVSRVLRVQSKRLLLFII